MIRNATEMYFRLEEIGFVTLWKRSNFVRKKENENWQIVMTILLLVAYEKMTTKCILRSTCKTYLSCESYGLTVLSFPNEIIPH